MKLTSKELDTLIIALDHLIDSEQDTINHTVLMEKLREEQGYIQCASCGDYVLMNSEDLCNTTHLVCGNEVK